MENKYMENKYMDWATHYNRIIVERRNKTRNDDCVVCLDTLLNKKLAYLPCKHSFHYECFKLTIDSKNYTCPLCRYDLLYPLQQLGYRFMEEEPMTNFVGLEGLGAYGIGSMRIISETEIINHYDHFFYEDEVEAHYVDEHITYEGEEEEENIDEVDEGDDVDDDLDSRMFIARYVIRYF